MRAWGMAMPLPTPVEPSSSRARSGARIAAESRPRAAAARRDSSSRAWRLSRAASPWMAPSGAMKSVTSTLAYPLGCSAGAILPIRHRHFNGEDGPGAVGPVPGANGPPHGLDEAAADGKPEAGPGAAAIRGMHPVELVEDPLQILWRDAVPLVQHLKDDPVGRPLAPKLHRGAGGGVFRRIVEE